MGFNKIYPNRKDKRKQYPARPQSVDPDCRPGGSCPACKSNRSHSTTKKKMSAEATREE